MTPRSSTPATWPRTFDIARAIDETREGLAALITPAGRPIVSLGGDHTMALPGLQAMHGVHGPLALVHFDAHLDTWNTYFDAPYTHGTPFRRASEQGLIVKGSSAHVGIRGSLYDRQDLLNDEELGFTIVHCRDIDRIGVDGIVERVVERVGDHPVYVSIDIDVLDPAFAPATGTPEAGGMTSRELLGVLRDARAQTRRRRHRRGVAGLRPRRGDRGGGGQHRLRAGHDHVRAGEAVTAAAVPVSWPGGRAAAAAFTFDVDAESAVLWGSPGTPSG